MATSVTMVALSQMVDISLNSKEGVIDFQVLHTLLHIMIKQLSLSDVAVEFRGPDSERIQSIIATRDSERRNTIVGEYEIVSTNKATEKPKKKGPSVPKKLSLNDVLKGNQVSEEKKEKEIQVIERRKDSKQDPDPNPPPLKSPPGSITGITPDDLRTVVIVESHTVLPQYTVALSKQTIDSLQAEVAKVKAKLDQLLDLPTNEQLLEAARNPSTPIVDMLQLVNLNKRTDACEIAIEKMASLVEDIAKETNLEIMNKIADLQTSVPVSPHSSKSSFGLTERVVALEEAVRDIRARGSLSSNDQTTSSQMREREGTENSQIPPKADKAGSPSKQDKGEHKKQNQITKDNQKKKDDRDPAQEKPEVWKKVWSPDGAFKSTLPNVNLESLDPQEAIKLIHKEFQNLNEWVSESIKEIDKSAVTDVLEVSTHALEEKVNEYVRQLEEMNVQYAERIEELTDDMIQIQNHLRAVLPGGDATGVNAETTMDLANKLSILESEILSLVANAEKLQEDKAERDKQTEIILEEIDVLKIVKANREDLEDALGEKADACVINRKVSHDQFDAACDDLTRGIEEALSKLEEQEEMWHQTLGTIQREVGNKLDKNEVDPLKEFINSKLKALQEKFKALTSLKKEQEAAGTRNKILKDVNCISCDKDVIMKTEMDETFKPKPYAMPPNRNMAPYLAYELDQLRKQQKCVPGRNLNYLESALKIQQEQNKHHMCNRYCGGSHTITTPQQRVTRLGHFLDQWGPEITPIQEEFLRGKDNNMYKVRDDSLYSKASNKRASQASKTQNGRTTKTSQDPDNPQAERDTLVSPIAYEAMKKEEQLRSTSNTSNKKIQNIGTLPLNPQPEVASAHEPSIDESRGSQQGGSPRASQAQEGPRASQVQEGKRVSQASDLEPERRSTQRTSKVKIQDNRASQSQGAAESRASKVGFDARGSVQES